MRYIYGNNTKTKNSVSYDVVIIGSGIAGLYTALHIDENRSCCVLSKEEIDLSNSWLAQGGIAAAISTDDTPYLHQQDTLVAGAGLCNRMAVKVLVDEGPKDIAKLVELQVPFDLTDDGDLQITREGGHHKNRIVHAGGDATGRETVKALAHIASERKNITFMPHTFLVDILTDSNNAVEGLLVMTQDDEYQIISTRNVVLCTGGIGQVYKTSTNPSVATGDGLAAAVRAGAKLSHIEFIQFHPTGLYSDKEENRAFLISEAVRGEGGLLKNKEGVRFMYGQHELNELAPRDIVARAIAKEMERSGEDHVYVDITSKSEEFLAKRFPTIYNECLSRGINISKDWIPVCPVQHYLIGGIETDLNGKTCVSGLYACGEAAYTGVHGANRLASNSMLECLVFGRRAALKINEDLLYQDNLLIDTLPSVPYRSDGTDDYNEIRHHIQNVMMKDCSYFRNEKDMTAALKDIDNILTKLENEYSSSREYFEILNIASIAKAILTAAIARRNSIGAHYRDDC